MYWTLELKPTSGAEEQRSDSPRSQVLPVRKFQTQVLCTKCQ